MRANKFLKNIAIYKPGKDKIENIKAVKLSANENPLGSSKKIEIDYQRHFKELSRYCDGASTLLREEIAKINNNNINQIICGAGSDEIISMLIYAFCTEKDEILYSQYGFLMYPISAAKVGAKSIKINEDSFKTNIDDLKNKITDKTKLIFLANPNNPTGEYLTKDEITKIIKIVPKNILIIFDHAYHEYCNEDDYPQNIVEIAGKYENVVVTRTFSKIYGLASLRVGWCFANHQVIEILNKIRGPFNVSGIGQICALNALKDQEFINESIIHNNKWLKNYHAELKDNSNFKIYKSVGNFVLINFYNKENYNNYNMALLKNNIIAREVSSYGLHNYMRISIGKDEENEKVINILSTNQ